MRNLPILRRDTAALTSTVSAMDLLLAVIWYVFVQSHLGHPDPHALSPRTDQPHRKGCQGRRIQGVRGLADQVFVESGEVYPPQWR
jgi:hypothetical protein